MALNKGANFRQKSSLFFAGQVDILSEERFLQENDPSKRQLELNTIARAIAALTDREDLPT